MGGGFVFSWLHLHYKIPRNPTKNRVFVWRKLKRLGAILLHDSIWCLPNTPRTLEHFQWLVAEIKELDGAAMLWESNSVLDGQNEIVMQQFSEQVDIVYAEILDELKKEKLDLIALSKRYQQTKMQDYFHSEVGERVYDALIIARGGKKQE